MAAPNNNVFVIMAPLFVCKPNLLMVLLVAMKKCWDQWLWKETAKQANNEVMAIMKLHFNSYKINNNFTASTTVRPWSTQLFDTVFY